MREQRQSFGLDKDHTCDLGISSTSLSPALLLAEWSGDLRDLLNSPQWQR